jgi:hypothetical protein
VARESLYLFLVVSKIENLEIVQRDINTAFLNVEIDVETYVELPDKNFLQGDKL